MSAADPPPPRGPSLIARLGWAAKDALLGRGDEPRAFDAVKLVHSEDLQRWDRFPRCQDFDGITYGQYRAEAYHLERRRRSGAEPEAVTASRYSHPVLFISHRWEDPAQPDPSGSQLRRLRTLQDCFIVYDYSSFPQPPRSEAAEADFRQILNAMDQLISNVVVLDAPDYLTRGWCVYEYVVAALRGTAVCDELHDGRFATLRDWANTPPPASLSFRDSFESQQQNFINERILAAVNDVLPIYADAQFQNEHDRDLVTDLLVKHLKQTLPPIKESNPYFGEWQATGWTDATLRPFFLGEARVPALESGVAIKAFHGAVPPTLREAVSRRYAIERYDATNLLNRLESLMRLGKR